MIISHTPNHITGLVPVRTQEYLNETASLGKCFAAAQRLVRQFLPAGIVPGSGASAAWDSEPRRLPTSGEAEAQVEGLLGRGCWCSPRKLRDVLIIDRNSMRLMRMDSIDVMFFLNLVLIRNQLMLLGRAKSEVKRVDFTLVFC